MAWLHFLLFHSSKEFIKQVCSIQRAAVCFRMELYGKGVDFVIPKTFTGVVVGVDVGNRSDGRV